MPRPKAHSIYRNYIAELTYQGMSSYAISRQMKQIFHKSSENDIGQKVPVESTVNRIRKEIVGQQKILDSSVGPVELWKRKEIDKPWRRLRKDPDGIPDHVGDWIAVNILPNVFIMRDLALTYPKFGIDHYDAVTRRIAMWIARLLNTLEGEHPQLVWSIAWMYAGEELSCEKQNREFNPRPFDCYVAEKPWASPENRLRYARVVKKGEAVDLKPLSMFYVLHLSQIPSESKDRHKQFEDGSLDRVLYSGNEEALKVGMEKDVNGQTIERLPIDNFSVRSKEIVCRECGESLFALTKSGTLYGLRDHMKERHGGKEA